MLFEISIWFCRCLKDRAHIKYVYTDVTILFMIRLLRYHITFFLGSPVYVNLQNYRKSDLLIGSFIPYKKNNKVWFTKIKPCDWLVLDLWNTLFVFPVSFWWCLCLTKLTLGESQVEPWQTASRSKTTSLRTVQNHRLTQWASVQRPHVHYSAENVVKNEVMRSNKIEMTVVEISSLY